MHYPFRLLILLAALSLVLAACAGDDDDDAADPTATDAASAPTEEVDETTPTAVEDEPTATSEAEATVEPTAEPTAEPTSEPTAESTAEATVDPTAEGEGAIPDTPAGQQLAWIIESLNAADPIAEDEFNERFTEQFIAMVPFVQTVAGMAQVADEYGPFTFDDFLEPPTDTQVVARLNGSTEEAVLIALLTEPTDPYRIDFIQIVPESAIDTTPTEFGSWEELDPLLAEQAPQVSFQAAEIGEDGTLQPIHALNPDERLSMGSAFKLYILGELARQVEEGTLSWDDELEIRDEWKSLPTGVMQDEAAGTPFTLRQYAEQMISISDNTATDHLLFHLGRENVEAMQSQMGHGEPEANMPMLATRELFALKILFDEQQRQDYAAAPLEEQRQFLETEVLPAELTIEDGLDWMEPRNIDTIGWYASTTELSQAMASLREMSQREGLEPIAEILSINPGIEFDPAVWNYVAFKGGSELGVLNFTWMLERNDGRWFTMSVTVNDSTNLIDETAIIRLAGGAALLLAETP